MKVLHIIWSSNIGGIESVVLNLASAQQNHGIVKPTLFAAKSEGPLFEKAQEKNIDLIKGNFKKGSSNIFKINECIKLFQQFDILHLHSFNPIIALAAIRSKRKIVFTEHGNFAFERKQGISEKFSKKLQELFINKCANHITFNSEFSKATAIAKYHLTKKPLSVVYNGVELPPTVEKKTKSSDTIRIGFVGRLVEVKRVDRLIEVISAINDKSKIKVELIGDGPLRQNILNQLAEKNLTNIIKLLGFKNNLSIYYSQWDLLLAPSTNEAFGLVAIEAYSNGCAVAVFSDGGGLAELVNQCEPNMVFKSTNELTAFIESLIEKSQDLNEINIRNHRKAFAQQFSIEKMESAINQVYLSL
ncbi:MAG: glycosyltransferase family 4 protein [Bacteroidota bacterium]|jgi:glycosyltransferase involved in cell wall biosynthesis